MSTERMRRIFRARLTTAEQEARGGGDEGETKLRQQHRASEPWWNVCDYTENHYKHLEGHSAWKIVPPNLEWPSGDGDGGSDDANGDDNF